MPHNPELEARVATLNQRYANHGATAVLERALSDEDVGRIALVSSFGAESVVLLHMVATLDVSTPVLFIDTQMLFPETLAYQTEVSAQLGLTDMRVIRARPDAVAAHDPEGLLHKSDTDACCDLRKTEPLERALSTFDAWITGRKRFQSGSRATLDFFESEEGRRIKVNPLAHWTPQDVQDYMINNRLPRHPLISKGYPSIGCAPCTSKVAPGEDPRAGRWRNQEKEECGIHFVNGKLVRGPIAPTPEPEPVVEPTPPQEILVEEKTPMNTIVTDAGFAPDTATHNFVTLDDLAEQPNAEALDLPSDSDPIAVQPYLQQLKTIRIDFPSFADGRGFTLAQRLRLMGFTGLLRANGHVIADQYAMARRAGFDEVEISPELAARQPWEQWKARANWGAHDYQSRLRTSA